MPRQSGPPIYFTKLVIENIRCFRDRQELKLVKDDDRPARWTLILGDNGVGKTTLLQSLAHMRPKFNPPPDDEADTHTPVEPEFAKEADESSTSLRTTDLISDSSPHLWTLPVYMIPLLPFNVKSYPVFSGKVYVVICLPIPIGKCYTTVTLHA